MSVFYECKEIIVKYIHFENDMLSLVVVESYLIAK